MADLLLCATTAILSITYCAAGMTVPGSQQGKGNTNVPVLIARLSAETKKPSPQSALLCQLQLVTLPPSPTERYAVDQGEFDLLPLTGTLTGEATQPPGLNDVSCFSPELFSSRLHVSELFRPNVAELGRFATPTWAPAKHGCVCTGA
ncbi:hypothetical protein UY3_08676 [Chelonia mydas]|uniref:Uncharacterized protein n=1 Tax=Chelonia mydas TaxID=8469 RepID=M7B872_CHEMY|nr:hypothetical protein UY3_08676 [Chelonia mydas]